MFKAKNTTRYLETYIDYHRYAGTSLYERTKLSNELKSILKVQKHWIVTTIKHDNQVEMIFHTTKLIVSSGLTSIQNMPTLPGRESFAGPIIHQENFGSSSILTSPHQNITILGGGKSSADMAYSAAKAGKSVNWVFKETGTTGPGFFMSPKGKGPYKNAIEIRMTRLAATFVPSF